MKVMHNRNRIDQMGSNRFKGTIKVQKVIIQLDRLTLKYHEKWSEHDKVLIKIIPRIGNS